MLHQIHLFRPFPTLDGTTRRCNASRRPSAATAFSHSPRAELPSRTRRIMERISSSNEVGGAGGAYSYDALKRLDLVWSNICSESLEAEKVPEVVSRVPGSSKISELEEKAGCSFDVLVCGGTLGIFIATALVTRGLHVAIIERNLIKGREQEWNISRKELLELVEVGILTKEEIEHIITVKFNPNRCGFEKKGDIWVEDILNLGVSPANLVETVKRRFISLGGKVFEAKVVSSIHIYDDAAIVQLTNGEILSSHLIIDSMGNFSPIVKQIRSCRKPDGVCLVVGSCSRGFSENTSSDIIFSSSSVKKVQETPLQYFWEAFPAGTGPTDRTTYMFTYVEAKPGSPKLEHLLEDYWDLLPSYQGVPLEELEILRVIFGIFPTYRDSPLPAAFDRILQVGDASGIQSPVSFGGFGSMTRHLNRLSTGIYEAVKGNFIDAYSLSLINPYMPNLSASWLFQRAMSARVHTEVSSTFINELLYFNFQAMQKLGNTVIRPFLQDVIQFEPLVRTLVSVMINQPQILPSIFKQVGLHVILDWSVHFVMLGYYTFLSSYIDPAVRPWINYLPERKKYEWTRHLEAWKYGSGLDYKQVE
ncbi:unnamed protein product [Musa acuminata subsp. malaccensis]|uniref:(wild Malaysian banana) hypothetical protein n=1 Tax=Musa acuminata subsp. malaccensis TaxID=214687 RepID=A0A804I9N6_MUSAM|nr:PREDICTED: uncharacterized protein LOC103977631 isoform X1 [Musa acuminata subsp. malaccensis]CAG1849499.1 unnamed protein product [Musa acuminata subsp. malaccensis]